MLLLLGIGDLLVGLVSLVVELVLGIILVFLGVLCLVLGILGVLLVLLLLLIELLLVCIGGLLQFLALLGLLSGGSSNLSTAVAVLSGSCFTGCGSDRSSSGGRVALALGLGSSADSRGEIVGSLSSRVSLKSVSWERTKS